MGDAAMSAWFGVDGQRWDMHAWQHATATFAASLRVLVSVI